MKAIQIHAYGDVDQLKLEEVPDPTPGPGEALVRVAATSVNPIDYKIRSGVSRALYPQAFPAILGRDLAGVVVAVGTGVTDMVVGDRVMGVARHTYAELAVAKSSDLCRIPERLEDQQAGAIPLVTTTGTQLIERASKVLAGQRVLVVGALGSVGRTAVFVAKSHGAVVLAGVRKSQVHDAEGLGANQLVALDDDAELASVPELDVVADTVNKESTVKLLPRIKRNGILASVVGAPPQAKEYPIRVEGISAQPDSARLRQLAEDVRAGRLEIPVGKVLPFVQVREAHRLAEKGGGKIVLVP